MPVFSPTVPNHAHYGIWFECGSRSSQAPVFVSGTGVTLAGVEALVVAEGEVPEEEGDGRRQKQKGWPGTPPPLRDCPTIRRR